MRNGMKKIATVTAGLAVAMVLPVPTAVAGQTLDSNYCTTGADQASAFVQFNGSSKICFFNTGTRDGMNLDDATILRSGGHNNASFHLVHYDDAHRVVDSRDVGLAPSSKATLGAGWTVTSISVS